MRLLPEGDVNMKFLENHWASITGGPFADADRRDVARELSGAAADAGADGGDSGEDAGLDDRADVVRDFDGGIALHAEWRAAADAAGRV